MKQILRILLPVLLPMAAAAQENQGEMTITDAEKAFAGRALATSIRAAFLEWLDSSAVVFDNGEIFNGRARMLSARENSLRLYWKPVFSATGAGNGFGFTTGPFELKRGPEDTVLSSGQFSSVWKKNAAGQWKVILDLGIHYSPSMFHQPGNGTLHDSLFTDGQIGDWREPEKYFLDQYGTRGQEAYATFLLEDSWFNIDGQAPCTSRQGITLALKNLAEAPVFEMVSGGISAGRDMIYVYGYTKTAKGKSNYLRVWVHTRTGWKIALQVI